MKYRVNQLKYKRKKRLIIIATVLILVVIGAGIFANVAKKPNYKGKSDGTSINYFEATQKQKQAGEYIKANSNDNAVNNEQKGSPKTSIIITDVAQYGNQIEVRAYATEISSSGSCKITATKDNKVVSRTVRALPNANTSSCQTVDIPVADFTSGLWSIKIDYSSNTATAESNNVDININK